ncbi:MAG: protein kinase [Phycisphaerales bacterium]|nr:protein kinase [Phycisphaerales bacterium]
MAAAACPPSAVIEALVAGTCTDQTVISHLEGCPACRAAVDQVRMNQEFMAEVLIALAAPGASGPPPGGEHAAAGSDLLAGYQLGEELYRGGQGVVYRAVQTRTNRTVAVKILPGGSLAAGRQRERFEREVRMAAGLRHPNIVTVHDSGYTPDGRCALVMEYIEGVHLDRWSRSLDGDRSRNARRRALRARLGVMIKVCDAVLYAHQHSIVHRDLKPGNILVDAAGEPHILDFGIARDLGPEQRTRLTLTGEFAGTLAYASPEQVSGDPSRVDTRTDIYTLGVIMYELVSGRMPYPVDGPMSRTLRSIESAEPAPLPRRMRDPDGPWVDGEVTTIILKAMAKDPARRYQTAAGVRNDLARYLAGEAIAARRDSTWYVLRKTAARHRFAVGAAAMIFILLAAFGAAMAWQARRLQVRGRELAARGTELASALSASNIERGRALAAAGNIPLAEDTVFPKLIRAGVTRIDGPEAGFSGSPEALHAYWALWDVFRCSQRVATLRTGREVSPHLPAPAEDRVTLLYFDQDGRRINALDGRGQLRSWSTTTWESVRERNLFAPVEGVNFTATVAPSGSIAIFGAKMIRVINPETGDVEAQADDPDDQALGGAFSPDGTLIATTGRGNRLRVRDARSPATVVMTADGPGFDLPGHSGSKPVFSPDGALIVTKLPDGALGLWNARSGALERSLRPPAPLAGKYSQFPAGFGRPAFAPDGTIAVAYGFNLVVWPGDGSAPRDFGAPGGSIEALAFLPGSEGWAVVSCGNDPAGRGGITTIWDLASGNRRATIWHPDDRSALAISPDARLIAVGTIRGTVWVHAAASEPHVTTLQTGRMWPFPTMALSPDGRVLAITTGEGLPSEHDVVLIDLKTRATINKIHRTGPEIRGLKFARDGLSLFEIDKTGRVRQWDLNSESYVREFAFPEPYAIERDSAGSSTNTLRLSPDGRILARARFDGLIGLWDVPSGRWIGLLDGASNGSAVIDFSADGRTLAAQHLKTLVLWDVQTRRPKRTIAIDSWSAYSAARFSPDGRLMTRSAAGRLQFCDADTGGILSECSPDTAGVGAAFHPGGAVFFTTAYQDSSIRLLDTRTGSELLSLQKHNQYMFDLLLTPDGNTLISSDWVGTVLVWDLTYYNDRIRRELAYRAAHPGS